MSTEFNPIEPDQEAPSNKVGLVGFIISLVSIIGCGVLSLLGVIVSLVGLFKKPRGLAITGLCLSLATTVGWIGIGVVIYKAVDTAISMSGTSLAASMWIDADLAAYTLAKDPLEGSSGKLPSTSWDYEGARLVLASTWKRDGEDILITVAPKNQLPEGVVGPPATLRLLPDGKTVANFAKVRTILATNANTWTSAFLGPITDEFLNQLEVDVKAITAWSDANDGVLPDTNTGQSILSKMLRTTNIMKNNRVSGGFTMTTLTYVRVSDGYFKLKASYDAKYNDTSSSRSVTCEFTVDGKMADPVGTLQSMGAMNSADFAP